MPINIGYSVKKTQRCSTKIDNQAGKDVGYSGLENNLSGALVKDWNDMIETLQTIRTISNRLAISLAVLVLLVICGGLLSAHGPDGLVTAPMAAFAAGVVGGFVGLQRRLKSMTSDDLTLLANSWVYVCLSPLVGGILAVVLYVLFISTLVSGELFPKFVPDDQSSTSKGFAEIFAVHGDSIAYAKMLFWSFVSGFSERFVTDIVSKFDTGPKGGKNDGV